jgi:two-component system, chemotaxis family, CheB/CheR fusion protein
VLIYLDTMQEHAISRFHFALDPGGFLLLGKSETAASSSGLFAPLDKEARLYARQESARHPAPAHTIHKEAAVLHPLREAASPATRQPRKLDLRRHADRVMVQRYGPPRVIVNGNLEPVAEIEETAAFLGPASGIQNQKVLEVVKKSQADALKSAIRTAGKTGQSIRIERIHLGEGASLGEVSLEVTPLGPDRQHFLIVVEDEAGQPEPDLKPGETPTGGDRRKPEMRISRLEKELASTRVHLESVIVEQEAANEEVIASNEELQSLNEELESSKEELEATNEELTTVNQELQVRNTELENAREFAQATIDTVRGALVVLGPDLRVLTANHSFYRTFRLSPAEVERRFIYELGDGLSSVPKIQSLLQEILPGRTHLTLVEQYDPVARSRSR